MLKCLAYDLRIVASKLENDEEPSIEKRLLLGRL